MLHTTGGISSHRENTLSDNRNCDMTHQEGLQNDKSKSRMRHASAVTNSLHFKRNMEQKRVALELFC